MNTAGNYQNGFGFMGCCGALQVNIYGLRDKRVSSEKIVDNAVRYAKMSNVAIIIAEVNKDDKESIKALRKYEFENVNVVLKNKESTTFLFVKEMENHKKKGD